MVLGKVLLRDLDRQLWGRGHREILDMEHSMSKIRGPQAQSTSPSVGTHKCTSGGTCKTPWPCCPEVWECGDG